MYRTKRKLSDDIIESTTSSQAAADAVNLTDKNNYQSLMDKGRQFPEDEEYTAYYEDGSIEALSLALDAED